MTLIPACIWLLGKKKVPMLSDRDPELRTRVRTVFVRLNRVGANDAFSEPSTLSRTLEELIPDAAIEAIDVAPKVATFFATASVDMWLRAVHSLLVSASLTNLTAS
jgi:hypothetical protein